LLVCACLLAIISMGCSRSEEAPEKEGPPVEPGPDSTVKTEPAGRPAPAVPAPVKPATPEPATAAAVAEQPPFRVCALLNRKNGIARAGIEQNETGFSRVLKEGDSFWGYRLVKVDYDGKAAVFEKGGGEVTLKLSSGPAAPKTAKVPEFLRDLKENPSTKTPELFKSMDLTKVKPKRFEPEPWEIEAGIDPNDPKTWPPGYRGPAIERLLRKYPRNKKQRNLPLESARQSGKLKTEQGQ
jgi:hypothetical protein